MRFFHYVLKIHFFQTLTAKFENLCSFFLVENDLPTPYKVSVRLALNCPRFIEYFYREMNVFINSPVMT